jgi:hypothetical protein
LINASHELIGATPQQAHVPSTGDRRRRLDWIMGFENVNTSSTGLGSD